MSDKNQSDLFQKEDPIIHAVKVKLNYLNEADLTKLSEMVDAEVIKRMEDNLNPFKSNENV